MTENKVTGKKYRILTDAVNDIWDRISFWTKASDIEYDDGTDGEALKTRVGTIEGELTANGNRIYMDYQGGKYGYNTSASRGASTFHPFRPPHTTTYEYKDSDGIVVDMGEDHTYRYSDATKLYAKAYLKGWNKDTAGIKFVHHVHSTNNSSQTTTDTNSTTTGNYGATSSNSQGGCYTNHVVTYDQFGAHDFNATNWMGNDPYMECMYCHNGGYSWARDAHSYPFDGSTCLSHKISSASNYYAPACGYEYGQIVGVMVDT